jgi:peptidoglycan hydrolase-like protein with peptidoglycan-binding domain
MRRLLVLIAVAACFAALPAPSSANAQHAGIQVALRALGLYSGPIDGIVGPKTVAGIRAAQSRFHLPVTGIADRRTRRALGPLGAPLFGSRSLRGGDFGLDVSVLQYLLTKRGLYNGALDGYMGKRTIRALRRYQRLAHLATDGVVGPRTLAAFVTRTHVPVPEARVSTPATRVYVVRPGDSLIAIAAHFGVTPQALARANHRSLSRVLLIGTRLEVPAATTGIDPAPVDVRDRLDTWSAKLGVSRSLVRALAWMESGYQPNVVSEAGAHGVLQTLPTTRAYVENVLVGHKLPNSLDGDIQVGVLLIRHLLRRFDGNESLALAAWYQGEASVRSHGMYKVTKPFVANVLALKARM